MDIFYGVSLYYLSICLVSMERLKMLCFCHA